MALITEDERVNAKMSKFKLVLKEHLIENDNNNVKWIYQRLGNLDAKIQSTKYLQFHHPEWIGCTVMHLAALYRYDTACEVLLKSKASFTIQNDEGATPLHVAIKRNSTKGYQFIPYYIISQILWAHDKNNNFENPSNKYSLSHFHIACFSDNKHELVKKFVNHGVPIDHTVSVSSTVSPGYTGLHFAVENRRFRTTRTLLSLGANTQIKDVKGMTPLHKLLKSILEIADPACTEKYKSNGPDTAPMDDLISELSSDPSEAECAIQQSAEMMKLFLSDDNQDYTGLSQLHLACMIKDLDETQRFIKKATDINHPVDMNSLYWPGYTALHFAAHFDFDTVMLLLKNGADMNAKDTRGVTPFDICLRRYVPSDIHTIISLVPDCKKIELSDGKTRLSDVISAMTDADRFKKFLRRLLNRLHVHVPNDSPLWPGFSLMHLAVVLGKVEEDQSMLPILEELFSKAPTLLNHQEVRGCTPLHLAYRLQKHHVEEVLIRYHLTLTNFTDVVDGEGLSHTHIACTTNSNEFLEKLLRSGSDVNAVFKGSTMTCRGVPSGSTPLHFAVVHNIESAIVTLLDYDVNIYVKDANGMTPIHLIVVANHKDYGCGHILLNLEDLEDSVVDGVGLSHLHVACLGGYYLSTANLIENGANVHQKLSTEPITVEGLSRLNDWRGCTALDIALKKGYQECVDEFVNNDPEFLANNYDLILDFLANRYDCFVDLSRLSTDAELQARLKEDFGITALHLACWDYFRMGRFDKGRFDDVNAQIRVDSPIWPGWTPVHVFLSRAENDIFRGVIDRLVETGIDVLLANVHGDTVVHVAYRRYLNERKSFLALKSHSLVNTLLQSQYDFSVNPTSIEGITHFHIACAVGNADVVEKFLQGGLLDVNRPIDFFHETEAGQTPLHLVASTPIEDASMRLRTVDLLLKYGADVHTENSCGNTALHECARGESVEVFERIVKGGADANARNILGHTPLKYFLSKEKITVDEIAVLLRVGCHFNAFNPINEEGCLGRALCSIPREQIGNFVSALKDHPSNLIDASDENRTIIHNVVASNMMGENYVALIGELSKIGYDIDDKDKIGRTPLHLAARTQSVQGIIALLTSGADVNLTDNSGRTVIGYCLRACERCRDRLEDYPEIDNYYDSDDENEMPCRHIDLLKLLATHARKLLYCGLEVSEGCLDCLNQVTDMSDKVRNLSDRFFLEFEAVKKINVGSHEFPLSELLSENGAVIDYPTMSLAKRSSIDDFLRSDDVHKFRGEFREMAGIVQLQYRKAIARVDLLDKAKDSLMILARIRVDDLCCRVILKMLKNSELQSLIAAVSHEENTRS